MSQPMSPQLTPTGEPCWSLWPVPEAIRLRTVVVRDAGGSLIALTAAPADDLLRLSVLLRVREAIQWREVPPSTLDYWLAIGENSYAAVNSLDSLPAQAADPTGMELSIQSINAESSQIVRTLDAMLFDAVKAGASDVHLEATLHGASVRYRLDGVMESISEVPGRDTADQLVSRLKVVAELDIGERRLPQDGRFKRQVSTGAGSRDVDFRVSIMPSSFGEDAVVRLLDKSTLAEDHTSFTLDRLGFDKEDSTRILKLANKPYGMLLVTGPTGSGKTTTLYAVIAQTLNAREKLITIEDPVEYRLPGVVQIPVNEKKGFTFARGLRSILRHDPDKIMVGEIRDTETAQIASQAALTGHLVLTTIHANNAIDVIGRFMHMGLDLYNVVSSLNGVMAQRLVRKLCQSCAQPYQPDLAVLRDAGFGLDSPRPLMRPVGCPACRGSGYLGRRAIAEVLIMDDVLRDLIATRRPLIDIKAHAKLAGTRFLRHAALDCVARGETSLEELDRVTLAD